MLTVIFLVVLATCGALAVPIVSIAETTSTTGEYRLSGDIEPSHYDIYLDVSKTLETPEKPWTFDGHVTITAKPNKDIQFIILHASNMNITTIHIDNELITKMHRNDTTQLLNITHDIKNGVQFKLEIVYKGYLRDDMYGFYISSYQSEDNTITEYVATTQFQPTHARSAFPCFDEPQYKASFSIQIKRPAIYTTLSNMPNKGQPIENTDTFELTPPMSTYLVAFIVSKFKATDAKNNKYKIWARPTARNQTEYAAEVVENITKEMETFTNISYFNDMNMPKMDMVALPDFAAGAMENWGLLTYRETALLVDDDVSTQRNIQRVASVITHEVAHQWFGDYVTTKWWNNTWLNEGFATYFEYHATGQVYPDWEMKEQFVIDEQQAVFGVDALENTTPLNNAVETPTQISSHFGSISYNKGGSVIRMMEHFLGTENFKKGLNKYLTTNKLSFTIPDDLWKGFEGIPIKSLNDTKLSEIMNNWVNKPGYPVVTVSQQNTKFTIKQERFWLHTEAKGTGSTWYIPISYTTSKELQFTNTAPKVWLKDSDIATDIIIEDAEWILVNIQGAGYYRVNYDENLWARIKEALKSDKENKIHRLNRAQLIDDAMNLARAGVIKYKVALSVLDYLTRETEYYPWYSAFEAFRFLLQRFADDSDAGKDIRSYILSLMQALIKDKEINQSTDKMKVTEVYNHVNALQWACDLGDKNCVDTAKELFKSSSASIEKNMKSVVYCTAIKNGAEEDWNNLWEKYQTSNVNAEQVTILSALGCSTNEKILKNYLNKSINNDIRKQDAAYVFTAVYTGSSKGVAVAFEFLKNNHANISNSYGGMNALGNAIRGLADRLNTKDQIKDFAKFLETNKEDLKDVNEIASAATEKANANVAWAEKYSNDITDYIKNKRNGSTLTVGNAVLCVFLAALASYFTLT